MSHKRIDLFHMMIVAKYFSSINDFLYLQLVTKKYENILSCFHYNPISLTLKTRRLFPNLETLHLSSSSDETFENKIFYQRIVWFQVSKSKTCSSQNVLFKNVSYNEKEIFRYNTSHDLNSVVISDIHARDITLNMKGMVDHYDARIPFQSLTSIVLPPYLTSLGDVYYYRSCYKLSSITLPLSLQKIGQYFFYEFTSLTSIDIPSNVTHIGRNAFQKCYSLKSVTIGANHINIEMFAFDNCSKLSVVNFTSNYSNLNYINNNGCVFEKESLFGYEAFTYCSSLQTIYIPLFVLKLNSTFCNCSALRQVIIPKSLEIIGDYEFYECKHLKYLFTFEEYKNCGFKDFIQQPHFVSDTNTKVIYDKNRNNNVKNIKEIESFDIILNYNINTIKTYAFYDCLAIESVFLGEKISNVGYHTFENCSNLQKVKFTNSIIKELNDFVFLNCISLREIVLSINLENLKDGCFKGCSQLSKIVNTSTVKCFGNSCFYSCNNLDNFDFSKSVSNIGEYCFFNCSKMCFPVEFTHTTYIGKFAFCMCSNLTSVVIQGTLECLYDNTFDGCSSLVTVILPRCIKIIRPDCFKNCRKLENFILPENVRYIGFHAFLNCVLLSNIVINKDAFFISMGAFSGCSRLKEEGKIPQHCFE
ncbi:hypothetical protein EIN_281080 [Entamoeba invadens IP1]|uniref:Leucine rich repeat containing protein BspA family protein n=1 Tax=Entamoeba invadens IP1 TaxID=370355 RepID=A0A0A1TWY2_ENTIV|nr:hypothetical protein EIN_281080 [Entamoeba invadens IP1]ELP85747.1 hypothetical protein EIN_281080 [Entamoeba invadens IP1]|eukprot:XP_004185093.1 hypothetical protein EIN_281080 [Entamoeba invadens IP1]